MYHQLTIDLHGLTEEQAYGPILNALFELENNLHIDSIVFITGKGTGILKMVLERTLEEEGYFWVIDNKNQGSYTVYRKKEY